MFRPCSNKTLKALTCLFNTQNNSLIGLVNGGGRVGLRPASTTSTTTFWFSNMYPIRRKWSVLDPRWHLAKRSIIGLEDQSSEAYQETVNRLIPMGDVRLATQFRSLSVSLQPNLKEGGLFARLEWELDESAENRPNSEKLIDIVRWHLTHKSVASAFNFLPVEVHHVKGEPFIEDMRDHLTSTKLKVEFEGPDVHLEKIYRDFRNYGRIFNIIPLPPSSKDLPRYSMVHFTSLRSATNARNCLNGEFIDGTRLFIKYEKTVDGNSFIKSLTDHPRITVREDDR